MNTPMEVAGTSFAALRNVERDRENEVTSSPTLLRSYMHILARRKWTLLSSIVAALLIGLVITLVATREYTSEAVMEISRENDRVFEVDDQRATAPLADVAFYETQYNLLRSNALADRVIRSLNLARDSAFLDAFGLADEVALGADAPFVNAGVASPGNLARADSGPIRAILLENLTVEPVRNSQLVRVEFTSPDPVVSARIAQSWAENFITEQIERKIGETSFARNYLEKRLGTLRTALEDAERKSVEFANSRGIVAIQSETADGKAVVGRLLVEDTVADLNKALTQASNDRIAAEAAFESGAQGQEAGAIELTSPVLSPLRARRAELQSEYERLLTQFEPGYPAARSLQNQIRELDSQVAAEERRIGGRLSRDQRAIYQAAAQREQSLRARLQQVLGEMNTTKSDNIEYNILRRDADQNRQLYDAVLQRYMEFGVAGGVGPTNISIVDKAEIPGSPSAPSLPFNLLVALTLGLGLGLLVVIAQEQLDDAIKNPDDLERALDIPALGIVPTIETDDYEHFMQELSDPKSAFSEAILALQTSLSFSSPNGIPRSIALTSTQPSEGKSVTSISLACRLAAAGFKTLIVDTDMRSPSLHQLLDAKNERGLSNALSGETDIASLIHSTSWNNLDAMFAGPQPPNAAELLSSDRLAELLEALGSRYDNIIIDSPPVIGLADALLICSAAQAACYVVATNQTSASRAKIAIRRLRSSDANIIGGVLTKYNPKASLGYGYGYDYGYGYGENTK